jgi:hypothetical protein
VTSQHLIVAKDPAAGSRVIAGYMIFYSVGTGAGAIAATSLYGIAGWGAVSALGAGLSALALLVWAASRPRTGRPRRTGHRPTAIAHTSAPVPSAPVPSAPALPATMPPSTGSR